MRLWRTDLHVVHLVPLCRRHHRYKTHAGWRLHRAGDRLLVWTSPLGRTYTVHTRTTDDHTDTRRAGTPSPQRGAGSGPEPPARHTR